MMNHEVTPRMLFKQGYDTVEIAKYLGISEAEALTQLTLQRSRELNRPNPYREPTIGWPKDRIPYAGR